MKKSKKSIFMKQAMVRPVAFAVALFLPLFGAACGSNESTLSGTAYGSSQEDAFQPSGPSGSQTAADAAGGNGAGTAPSDLSKQEPGQGGLSFLGSEDGDASCATPEGYYYISTEGHKLQDGSLGYRLMYIDYASCQEICLCSAPGCGHDTRDCTAVLPDEEFPAHTSKLFLHKGSLYILGRQYDSDGSYSVAFSANGESSLEPSSSSYFMPTALYRMNPDGTGRQKVFSFDPDVTVEGALALDSQGLYLISKKLSSERTGAGEYISSSQRSLVFLDLSSYTLGQVSSLEFGDNVLWQLTGCTDGSFLFKGIDYGRKLTAEEYFEDDDTYHEIYKNSHTVFAVLDTSSGSLREFYRMGNDETHSDALLGNTLYVSFTESQKILGIDIATGRETLLTTHPQNYITGTMDNMLCCQSMDSFSDRSYYFINVDTGEIRHSGLVNKSLGWSLDLIAETDSDVLVIYDYDAVKEDGESYDIRLYQYGLISKEDLFSGKENYRKIQMAGKGY